jgi:3'(2'), 5'-bisphosphate nucleotidase
MNDHQLAKKLAEQAGQILAGVLNNFAPKNPAEPTADEIKAIGDLGDKEANDFLIKQLRLHRPNDVVLSEESIDPESRHNAKRVWIIDPLDGTASFSRGYPGFAVQVALWEADATTPGKITAAAVNVPEAHITLSTADPVHLVPEFDSGVHGNLHMQAVGWTLSARDDIRIVTSPSNPPTQLEEICNRLQNEFNREVKVERRGSVGAKMVYIISGNADIYVNTWGFNEWDIAAPLAVAHHYGLVALMPDGSEFRLNQKDVTVPGAIICRSQFAKTVLQALAESS